MRYLTNFKNNLQTPSHILYMKELRVENEEWDGVDWRLINSAIRLWHEREKACIAAEGGHFNKHREHDCFVLCFN